MKSKGLQGINQRMVCQSYLLGKLTYAISAWWGFVTKSDKDRLQGILNKAFKWGLSGGTPLKPLYQQVSEIDDKLFAQVLNNSFHVLNHLLPALKPTTYALRPRPHNRIVPTCSHLEGRSFINRMLSLDSY